MHGDSQMKVECIMPVFRGEPLQRFLADCASCSTVGQKNLHWFKDSSSCYTCAHNNSKKVRIL